MELLLTGAFAYNEKQLSNIKSLGFNITFIKDERVPLDIDLSIFDAVVCNSLFKTNDIQNFINLKYIQLTSAGLDRVPLDYINDNNIDLYNARGVYSAPIAEWVILKILEFYKNTKFFINNQANKEWVKDRNILELSNKNALIIGYGSIGEAIAKRLSAFDVVVNCADIINVESDYIDKQFSIDEIDKALEISDIIILTLPLTEDTRYLIDKKKFDIMKDSAVLVNVSRGEIINERDMINALINKDISCAILDVFENEPLESNSELWNIDNVIITPHNSFVGEFNNDRMYDLIYNNLKKLSVR